jgi:hypothetical protein
MFKVMFAIIASWSKYIKIGIMGIICCWLISVPVFLPVSVLSHIISQVQNFLSENFLLMNENIHKWGQKTNYYQIRARDEVEGFYLIIIGWHNYLA